MAPPRSPRIGCLRPVVLDEITNRFSEQLCFATFQFGKLYRCVGEGSNLTVKVFENVDDYPVRPGDNEGRLEDEKCLANEDYVTSHPNIVKFRAVSFPSLSPVAAVYDIVALDTVHNLLEKDNFSWLHRVKVAHGFASAVAHMHDFGPIPFIIRNISASHILLDQDYNPKLYDFSMISGGSLPDKREILNQYVHGCHGYVDPDYIRNGKWSGKCDVFAYGVVLIGLISKKVVADKATDTHPEPYLFEWAYKEYQGCKLSLVHESLTADEFFSMNDGVVLTKLAMECVDYNPLKRPTMKEIVGRLQKLSIIQNYADRFGLERAPSTSQFRNTELSVNAPIILSYEDLKRFTNDFSEENYIDIHQFGKLYHGKMKSRAVTVKTWEDTGFYTLYDGDNEIRIRDELVLLQHPKFMSHPHIVNMIGYCYENGRLGVVYDVESLTTLEKLIENDNFTWGCRIEFAIKLAGLLKFLQTSYPSYTPYVLRNFLPINILVDKNYNPKLFNFGMLSGGIMNEKEHTLARNVHSWLYYIDPYTNCCDYYTEVSDIFSFGMVLLNLITKKLDFEGDDTYDNFWAYNEYKRAASKGRWGLRHFSLVNKSFETQSGFEFIHGHRLSKLVMRCISRAFWERPTIHAVVKYLEKRCHSDQLFNSTYI